MRQCLCFLLIFTAALCRADVVQLDDGSRIVGTIVAIADGKLTIETGFAGTLELDQATVVALESEGERVVSLADGSRVVGTLAGGSGAKTTVQTEYGVLNIDRERITGLWQPGAPTPEEKAVEAVRPKWSTQVRGGINGSTGNTEYYRLRGGFESTLTTADDRLKFYGEGTRISDEGELSEKSLRGGIDFEHFLARKHSWYARLELESDDVDGPDLRVTGAGGYGYYFIRNEAQELRGRLGLQYRHETWDNAPTNESVGIDSGLYHRLELGWATMENEVTYTPSLEDTSDYLVTHESSLDIPLAKHPWSFRLGVRNEYTAAPPPDTEELDTEYFAEVVYTFK